MTKIIKLNDNYQYEIVSFSRNTTPQDGQLISRAYVTLKDPTSAEVEEVRGLALFAISSIKILVDEDLVYDLSDLDGKITSIDESINDMGKLTCNLYINL